MSTWNINWIDVTVQLVNLGIIIFLVILFTKLIIRKSRNNKNNN